MAASIGVSASSASAMTSDLPAPRTRMTRRSPNSEVVLASTARRDGSASSSLPSSTSEVHAVGIAAGKAARQTLPGFADEAGIGAIGEEDAAIDIGPVDEATDLMRLQRAHQLSLLPSTPISVSRMVSASSRARVVLGIALRLAIGEPLAVGGVDGAGRAGGVEDHGAGG